ncbi:helix-turn-helix transcriptional regulator [Mycolicibacterium lutetiense]|uniref:DNA-binding transcriptional regulator AlpA n=1 Tax=Mycolicibacterium lutetiense TaxID=1641992 RepID=A0ABS4ZTP2_9MYCO|nr:helix-turn-helix domain-containing protein [Mycolicibacterium lutetiense]MBP2452513.1 putative DNA-binding transcriptional regulator AlpA [Mycolicibacterium lutetiense]
MTDTLTSAETAALLGISPSTLATYRYRGTSPRFTRTGHRTVVYKRADVAAFIKLRDDARNWRDKTR